MKRVMVRYTVKPDRAAENVQLIRAVYEQLEQVEPDGLRYATFQLEDGVSFVHLAAVDGDGRDRLTTLPAFQAFQEGIAERCEVAPVAVELREIGSYGLR